MADYGEEGYREFSSVNHYNQSLSDSHPGAYDSDGNDIMEMRNPMNYLSTMKNVNNSAKGNMLNKDQSRFK